MAVQFFPDVELLLEILQDELPQGLYPEDRADDPDPLKRSYSSSELRAAAQMFATLYESLQTVANEKTISASDADGLSQWEMELFGAAQDSTQSTQSRRQALLAKFRSSGGISLPAIDSIVHGVLDPVGLTFAILPYSGQAGVNGTGSWILGQSPLGYDTYLGQLDPIIGTRQDAGLSQLDCSGNYQAAGLTLNQYVAIQQQAYTYAVMIYGSASSATLAILDAQLTQYEPARSTHQIFNNAQPPLDAGTINSGLVASVPWRSF